MDFSVSANIVRMGKTWSEVKETAENRVLWRCFLEALCSGVEHVQETDLRQRALQVGIQKCLKGFIASVCASVTTHHIKTLSMKETGFQKP
jgi:hypothetical protein